MLIIAGPGSGKTEVVARRVDHMILSGDARIDDFLVTTFTNKAALELKDRIQRKLPGTNIELMHISTIHSFCAEILRRYSSHAGITGDFRILDEEDQFLFIYTHRKDLELDKVIKGLPHRFFSNVIRTFNLATEELVEPEKLEDWCKTSKSCCCQDEADLWWEREVIAEAYRRYLELLEKESLADYAILQKNALKLLENNPQVLAELQGKYKEILVDEYQDTDAAQDNIIKLLAGDGKHLTVVGDDDQSIYRFRGATVKNILTFTERFPGAKLVTLEHNFRSRLPIVNTSKHVIAHNPFRIPKDLVAVRGGGSDVLLIHEHTAPEEATAMAKLLKQLHNTGKIPSYRDIALLLRSVRSYVGPYMLAFQMAGIPFNVIGDASFFDREEISCIYGLLNFLQATKPWGDVYLRHPLVGLSQGTMDALQSFKDDLLTVDSEEGLKSIGISDEVDLKKLLYLLDLKNRVQGKKHHSQLEVFYSLIEVTGCVDLFEKEADIESLLNLGSLSSVMATWDEFGKSRNIYPFMQYLKLLKEGGMDPITIPAEDAVQIMTIHQAKGLEFPVVVIGSAMNGRLPATPHQDPYEIPYDMRASGKPEEDDPHLDDERKLFYVAATRARDLLIVGTADIVNKRGGGPSQFLKEMSGDGTHLATDLTKAYIEAAESKGKHGNEPRPRHSFSQLAYFLQCPIRYKLAIIYGFETPKLDPIGYGANVHRALEAIHKRAIDNKTLTEEDVAFIVGETWASNVYTKPEREKQYMNAAIKHLQEYIREYDGTLSSDLKAETNFSFVLNDQVMLGKVDLIRRMAEGKVEIVDFKTSKEEPLEEAGIDLQLDLYALGAEESLGCQVAMTTVHFLSDGHVVSREWSPDRRNKALSRVFDIFDKIAKQDFSPNCSYCSHCDEFRAICPYCPGSGKKRRIT